MLHSQQDCVASNRPISASAMYADSTCTAINEHGIMHAATSIMRRRASAGFHPRRTSQSESAPPPGPPTTDASEGTHANIPIIVSENPRALWRYSGSQNEKKNERESVSSRARKKPSTAGWVRAAIIDSDDFVPGATRSARM